MWIGIIILVAVVAVGLYALLRAGIKSVTGRALVDELKSGSKPELIDVREPSEFTGGHIPGACNIPLGRIADAARAYRPDAQVVLVCRSGVRSARAFRALKKAGFNNLRSLAGGMSAWPGEQTR